MRLKLKPSIKEWVKAFLYALLILLVVRNFFYQVYVVESDSMEGSLKKGDFVLVNKVSYGARIPVTPLCIPFTDWYISSAQLPYWRIPGFFDIEQNDVILFNYPEEINLPIDRRTKMIKRVIGLPGDTIEINGLNFFVNGIKTDLPATVLFDFYLSHNGTLDKNEIKNKSNSYSIHELSPAEFIVSTTSDDSVNIQNLGGVIKFELFDNEAEENLETYFPHSPYHQFTLNHFGPIVVPKAGMKINLSPLNWPIYRQAITIHEEKKVKFKDDHFYIDGFEKDTYVFEQDYFFVAGDNRHSSVDSRHWGFVPESHMIGKVNRVLFSYGKSGDGIRWSRIFNSVE